MILWLLVCLRPAVWRKRWAIPVTVAGSRCLHVVRPDAPIEVAEELMRMHRVRRLPVLDVGGNLVGMLSLVDVVRRGSPARAGDDLPRAERIISTLQSVLRPAMG